MIKKISIRELRPGMKVARMQSDIWCHCPTLYTKEGVVDTQADIQAIIDEGYTEVFVLVDVAPSSSPDDLTVDTPSSQRRVIFSEELANARERYAQALLVARELFTAASKGQPMDIDRAVGAVDALHDSLDRNPGALGCLSRLTGGDAYLYAHSVNVSVLCMLVGQGWGVSDEEVRQLGLAGLFHDLGKTRLPIGLLNRRVKLTAEESTLMEGHCVHGLAILEAQRGVPRAVKRAVVEHHERFDGNGYPFGMGNDQISRMGKLLALADCFDALASKRTYKAAMPPSKALALMYGMRDKDFATEDVDRFIKIMGVYPCGSVVQLSTGEVAIVCEVNHAAPLAPLVNVVLDRSLNPMTPMMRDLSEGNGDGQPSCNVDTFMDAQTMDFDLLTFMLV